MVPVWSVCFSSVWFGVRLHHQISSSSSVSAPRSESPCCLFLSPRLQLLISSRRPQQHLAPLCVSLKKCQTSARIRSAPESRTGAEPSRTNRRPRFLSRTPCSWSWTRLKLSTWSSKSGSVFRYPLPDSGQKTVSFEAIGVMDKISALFKQTETLVQTNGRFGWIRLSNNRDFCWNIIRETISKEEN